MLRQKAQEVWTQVQQPIQLTEGVHLMLNPEHIRLGPLTSQGKVLIVTPEIQARPAITLGPRPAVAPKPLPNLELSQAPIQPGFRVKVETDLSFEQATAQLRKQMAGQTFETEKGTFKVVNLSVSGKGERAILEIQLKGKVNGKLHLEGRPVYDEATGTLRLQDLDYTLESRSWITSFGVWLYKSTLRKTLSEKANWILDKSLKDLKAQTQQGMNRSLAPGLIMKGTLGELKLAQHRILEDRFRIDAFMEGQVQLDFSGNIPGR
jgi:hypothetical protein